MKTLKTIGIVVTVTAIFSLVSLMGYSQDGAEKTKSKFKHKVSLSLSNNVNTGFSYKFGIKPIYGIFRVGFNYAAPDAAIIGIGAGTEIGLNDKSGILIEAMFNEYMNDGFNDAKTDDGVELYFAYSRNISNKFSFNVGPTFSIVDNQSGVGLDKKGLIEPVSKVGSLNDQKGFFIGAGAGLVYTF